MGLMDQPKMYTDVASWFHLLTSPDEYEVEAAVYLGMLHEAVDGPVDTILELGSGGGNNALHMKADATLTLTDLSEDMLALSRTIHPDLEHIQGDMRSVRLDREFDAVFVHDAVVYMTSLDDLRAAMETAFVHCRPGGAALFAPDATREIFEPRTEHGGHDGEDGRAMRYLEWVWDPDAADETYVADYAYLLREPDGEVRIEHDRHVCGLFSRDQWLDTLGAVGFEAERRSADLGDDQVVDAFVSRKPLDR
jgi:trans-aconitate methyltransferase